MIGNSLSGQNSDVLEEAFCYPHTDNASLPLDLNTGTSINETKHLARPCQVVPFLQVDATRTERRTLLRQVVGLPDGGLLAHWGSMAMLKRDQDEWSSEGDPVQRLRNASSFLLGQMNEWKNFTTLMMDVLVFQFPSGHIRLEEITEAALTEIVALASEIFGCSTVLFITVAWHSNIVDDNNRTVMEERNELVRTFARNYATTENSPLSVRDVEFLDFAKYSNLLIEANGLTLGISSNETYSMRLTGRWKNVIAQSCGEQIPLANQFTCNPNMFSVDGTHWCQETVHGRITAGQACILGCIYNKRHDDVDFGRKEQRVRVRTCSEQCNLMFMSLDPIRFNENKFVDIV